MNPKSPLSDMELIKAGKTKDVYKTEDGTILLKFKDTITGHPSGEPDPGGNVVIGSAEGVGAGALKMTLYYFELLKKHKIPTHYIKGDLSAREMIVRPAESFGRGLEFVIRYKAAGSFIRRFGTYCQEGDELPSLFEVTLKEDESNDPPATREILGALKLLEHEDFDYIEKESRRICGIIKDDLLGRGLDLYDIKLEFGRVEGSIALIDEISPGNMRVYRGGEKLSYQELSDLVG